MYLVLNKFGLDSFVYVNSLSWAEYTKSYKGDDRTPEGKKLLGQTRTKCSLRRNSFKATFESKETLDSPLLSGHVAIKTTINLVPNERFGTWIGELESDYSGPFQRARHEELSKSGIVEIISAGKPE
jgi:hypothetical protein